MKHRLICILLTLAAFIAASYAQTKQLYISTRFGKRNELNSGTKILMTSNLRQGRSQNKIELATRNDRFFTGSRYGKRADLQETIYPDDGDGVQRSWSHVSKRDNRFYTGSRFGKRTEEIAPEDDGDGVLQSWSPVSKRDNRFYTGSRFGKRTEEAALEVCKQSNAVCDGDKDAEILPRVKTCRPEEGQRCQRGVNSSGWETGKWRVGDHQDDAGGQCEGGYGCSRLDPGGCPRPENEWKIPENRRTQNNYEKLLNDFPLFIDNSAKSDELKSNEQMKTLRCRYIGVGSLYECSTELITQEQMTEV